MVKVYMQVPKDAQGLTSSLGRASIFDVCPARLGSALDMPFPTNVTEISEMTKNM